MDPNQQPEDNQQPEQQLPPQTPEEQMAAAGQNQWQYTSGKLTQDNQPTKPELDSNDDNNDGVLAEWSASEFVEHDKGYNWYGYLIVGAVLISARLFLVTKEIMSIVVTVLLAIVMAIYGTAKPKTVDYKITGNGVSLGPKHFNFSEFKSFSIIEDSAMPYIQLMPQRRFMVPITIFVDPEHTNEIAELIGQFLPYDQKKRDAVDKLSSRLRF